MRPLHSEAGLPDLWWIGGDDASELCPYVVDDVEVAVRPIVIAEAKISNDPNKHEYNGKPSPLDWCRLSICRRL